MPTQSTTLRWAPAALLLAGLVQVGCSNTLIFNPAFVNQTDGSIFPLAPAERNSFVLVRANNTTGQSVEFLVTVEREITDPENPAMTTIQTESVSLFTPPFTTANDLGVLFDCPILRVGLGEDLDRPTTSPGVYVGAVEVGVGGVGVPGGVNPLDTRVGNFACGDTIIFQALAVAGSPGGVGVVAYVLDADDLADEVTGLDTFANARSFLDETIVEDEDDE